MGSFRDPASIQAGNGGRACQAKFRLFKAPCLLFAGQGQAPTRKLAFDFMKAHYDEIVAKRPSGGGFDFGAGFSDRWSQSTATRNREPNSKSTSSRA